MKSAAYILLTTFLYASFPLYAAPPNNWPSHLSHECSNPKPQWIWCDDFEIDRSATYSDMVKKIDRRPMVGVSNSKAAAFTFKKGVSGVGGIKVAFGRNPIEYFNPAGDVKNNYREIYWRMFVYTPIDWVGNGADKLSRAIVFARNDWSTAMFAHVWSGTDPGRRSHLLLLDPASGTDSAGNLIAKGYNDFKNLSWKGIVAGKYPIFHHDNFGKWHCVEARAKLNDANKKNAIFQLFINNELDAERINFNWIGNYSDYGINAVFFENYWNNTSPIVQTRYFDNLVISSERIGCG